MIKTCPHCDNKVIKEDDVFKCATAKCGVWKSYKAFCQSGVRAYLAATKHYLSMPRNMDNMMTADEMLHKLIAYLKEAEKL